jgi:phage-related protein
MSKENIVQYSWQKGQSGNPNGRPRKFVCQLKDMGYNKQDINQTIENMMAMTLNELADIFKDDNCTILERTVANAMRKSLERGELYSIETLIGRLYGNKTDITTNGDKIEAPIIQILPPSK